MGGGPQHPDLKGHLLFTLSWPEPKEVTDRIRKAYPNLKVTYVQVGGPRSRLPAQLPDDTWRDVTILSTLGTLPKDPALLPNIEFIHFSSAGLDWLTNHPIYTSTKVPLTSSSGIHGPTIAEWVLMTSLVSAHKYNLLHSWQRHEHWGKQDDAGGKDGANALRQIHDFVGQRLGVLGYGSIGRQTARVARAMGMEVYAYTASPRESKESRKDSGYWVPGTGDADGEYPAEWFSGTDKKSLHEFLGQDLDVLLISVPLTEKTQGLLGREEFEILGKRNAFVANISRGKIVVQDELIKALELYEESGGKEGLRGAALDVADPEPLPDGHPLFRAPNAIVTPHVSGLSVAYGERAAQVVQVNVDRFARGKELVNLVDRERGY